MGDAMIEILPTEGFTYILYFSLEVALGLAIRMASRTVWFSTVLAMGDLTGFDLAQFPAFHFAMPVFCNHLLVGNNFSHGRRIL